MEFVTGDRAESTIDADDVCLGIGDDDSLLGLESRRRDPQVDLRLSLGLGFFEEDIEPSNQLIDLPQRFHLRHAPSITEPVRSKVLKSIG